MIHLENAIKLLVLYPFSHADLWKAKKKLSKDDTKFVARQTHEFFQSYVKNIKLEIERLSDVKIPEVLAEKPKKTRTRRQPTLTDRTTPAN